MTRKREKRERIYSIVNIVLTVLILLLILAICLIKFVITPMKVEGDSMLNTLKPDDYIWVQKVGYSLERGDLIVFDRLTADNREVHPVKRVIAVGGDTIRYDYENGTWILNDEPLVESYIYDEKLTPERYFRDVDWDVGKQLLGTGITVGEDELFVLGDHRSVSFDSHYYGPIKVEQVIGKVC